MNETWSTITPDDVLGEFTPTEAAILNHIQGGTDNLAAIVSRVVDAVRKAYLEGGRDTGDAGTIPDSEKSRALALARWQWLVSVPRLKLLQTWPIQRARGAEQKLK